MILAIFTRLGLGSALNLHLKRMWKMTELEVVTANLIKGGYYMVLRRNLAQLE
jgi:hypothetical protein